MIISPTFFSLTSLDDTHNMSILAFTDLHAYCHKNNVNRLYDCLDTLKWVFKTARERKIKDIVFGGDLYQERQKIQVISYQKVFEILEENSDLNLWLLLGNHDLWYSERLDITSIVPLRALPNVRVIDRPCTLEIDGKDIDFLPYTKSPIKVIDKHFSKRSDILFGHVAVEGAYLNTFYETVYEPSVECDDLERMDVGMFEGWKRVLLGHFHGAQKLNEQAEYIGSPLQLNFAEAHQEKHIIVLDGLKVEYIKNDFSPKHLIIKESEVDQYNLEGNFIQLIVDDMNASSTVKLKNELMNYVGSLSFKETYKKDDEIKETLERGKVNLKEGEIISRYVSAVNQKLLESKLTACGKSIIQVASEENL